MADQKNFILPREDEFELLQDQEGQNNQYKLDGYGSETPEFDKGNIPIISDFSDKKQPLTKKEVF